MIEVREATEHDAGLILDFIIELAVYEQAKHEVRTNIKEIADTLFGPTSSAKALICNIDDKPVGYAVYFFNYSTWLGKNGLYLEDVYICPQARGKGAGKLMLKTLAKIAVNKGCGRFEWSVLDWNTPAIEFYEALGAKPQDEWIVYRLAGESLLALAHNAAAP